MEETAVVIVGAGPSGLALAVDLSRMGIKTVILEKTSVVTEDPRGIAITGDAVRISYQLGIGHALVNRIGQSAASFDFHYGTFQNKPFASFDLGHDWLEQALPQLVLQFQPNFERELRKIIAASPYCELREECEVFESEDGPQGVSVGYRDKDGNEKHIRGHFLVGADGKTGIVRKKFLEPLGVKQEVGIFNYQETWVASNFQIIPPTPESHPDFPLWNLGYTPDEVCDAFWPIGFHFCNDLARPSVSGPFGPKKERFWRHEYSVQKGDSVEDPLKDLLQNFRPWLIRPASHFKGPLPVPNLEFPQDCVRVLRCRAFNFAHKVANHWHHARTLIIGDAAHVFPPFGGQGIAAGLRDARALAWRLNLLVRLKPSSSLVDADADPAAAAAVGLPPKQHAFLDGWQHEQRQLVDRAARMTKNNAVLTVERGWLRALLARLIMRVISVIPGAHYFVSRRRMADRTRLRGCEGGFFLPSRGGGRRVAQVWVREYRYGEGEEKPVLSDEVLFRRAGAMAVVVLVDGAVGLAVEAMGVESVLMKAGLPEEVVGMGSVTFLLRTGCQRVEVAKGERESLKVCIPCDREELVRAGIEPMRGYDERGFERRVGGNAKYVVVRPDCFVHSVARTGDELLQNLAHIQDALSW